MNVKELKNLIEQKADIVILDVRNAEELENGFIKDCVNISLKEIPGKILQGKLPFDKTQKIIVNCQTGGRSSVAVMMLNAAGYSAQNLDGGFVAWVGENTH